MTISVETTQYSDHARVTISGTYDVQEAMRQFTDLVALSRRTGVTKILVDFRRLQGVPAATHKTMYALTIQEEYRTHLESGGRRSRWRIWALPLR